MIEDRPAPGSQTTKVGGPAAVESPARSGGSARYGSDRILDLLRDLGCRYLPGNPGSSFRGLHDSIVNHGGNREPQMLLCHNEQIAVSLAHGYAKAAQRTGFAVVHDLVGLMQASMGIYNACIDQVPLVILGGGGPADTRQRRPIDWIHSASAQSQLVRDYVKWDAEPIDLRGSEEAIAQAARIAATTPTGPVYVTLDSAVQERELTVDDDLADVADAGTAPAALAMDPAAAEQIAHELLAAERPMIVVGPMGYSPAATAAVVALADAVGAACLDVDHATVVPSEFSLNLTGQLEVLHEADLVLALGLRDLRSIVGTVIGRRVGSVVRRAVEPAAIIDVGLRDLTLRGWGDGGAASSPGVHRVLADPTTAAQTLAAAVADLASSEPADRARRRQQRRDDTAVRHTAILTGGRDAVAARWNDAPISPGRVVNELWDIVQGEAWVLAMRNTRTFPPGIWRFQDANDYLGHSGGAGVGYGPGAMVGAALGAMDTGRLAIGIVGDGDLLMHPGALWTATHFRIPMLLVVNDNSSFYNDEDHQLAVAQDRGRPEENAYIGMRMVEPRVDIAALARSYGAWAAGPIEDPACLGHDLREGLEAAQGGQTAVVHVRTAPR